ncbi:hypothetical protein E2562_029593 [Oryza meyeriana var. granulata]|uniref:CCHC-type domain-containing protein n=1 Tax=Oryza meyeriana var. granulata TaxID=110450 RepID=A0A6G1E3V7_9ORYZ|nr:hypothetical protein E2562_029593 [Oryza meyeriana var. granulata]
MASPPAIPATPATPAMEEEAGAPATNVGGVEKPTTEEIDVREPDIFENEEEYVGVNDEHIYVPPPPQPAWSAQPDENTPQSQSSQPTATGDGAPEAQIKVLPAEHNCASTKLQESKMTTQGWCVDRLNDWLKKNPQKGANDAKKKLEEDFEIKLKYSKAWFGMKLALKQIHGRVEPMTDRSQWPVVDLGFKVHPPRQKRGPRRPRVKRIRGCLEANRRRVRCKRCKAFGHFEKTCKLAEPAKEGDLNSNTTPRKRLH